MAILTTMGLAFKGTETDAAQLLVVDGETLDDTTLPAAKTAAQTTLQAQGTVLVMFRQEGKMSPAVNQLLPLSVELTPRRATALQPRQGHAWTSGLGGGLPKAGRILLEAVNTDWSQFNQAPENAKCGATVLYEQLIKPGGAALVEVPAGNGRWLVSSLDVMPDSQANVALWRRLFANAGVRW
jgi:hypothetical protein